MHHMQSITFFGGGWCPSSPPPLRNIIIYHVDNYYNNDLHLDHSTTTNNPIFDKCIIKQASIGWGQFIRGRLRSSFHPVLNKYYRINKLGRRFKSSVWYRHIIKLLWKLHHTAWIEYCDSIHVPPTLTILASPAKILRLTLVAKINIEAEIHPEHKNIFFNCTTLQYLKWSTNEL